MVDLQLVSKYWPIPILTLRRIFTLSLVNSNQAMVTPDNLYQIILRVTINHFLSIL